MLSLSLHKKWITQKSSLDFDSVYYEYFDPILFFLDKRLPSFEVAQDICQEVFTKVYTKQDQYQSKGFTISSWIYTIARNEISDYYRKNKQVEKVFHIYDEDIAITVDEKNITLNNEVLINLFKQLTPEEIELIDLKYFEKKSHQEIAQILEISPANSKVKLHRIIEKLKNIKHHESI